MLTKKSFTLVELIVALSLGVLLIGGILTLYEFTHRAWHSERVKSEILVSLEMTMERIKKEIRLSSADKMFFYPAAATTYTAISLPLAIDDDGDNFIELDAGTGMIEWDKTVIYHLYINGGKTELRRTVFNPRIDLTDAQRQTQIDNVVANGQPIASTPNYNNWDPTNSGLSSGMGTRVLISGSPVLLEIIPQLRQFDGYNSIVKRSANISFGSISLASGNHTLKFKITGKNVLSSDYNLGIDCIRLTPSGSDREGEDYLHITHPDGSTGIFAFSGGTPAAEDMSAYGSWGGESQLSFNSQNIDDFITLKICNDVWRESNFLSGDIDGVVSEYTDNDGAGGTMTKKDTVLHLIGNQINWEVTEQTKDLLADTETFLPGEADVTYRNIISQEFLQTSGRLVRIQFSAGGSDHLKIDSAYLCCRSEAETGEQDCTSPNARITFGGGANTIVIPAASSVWSDWIDIGENFSEDNSYFVTFHIPLIGAGDTNSVSYWPHPSETSCYWQTGDHSLVDNWGASGTATNNLYGTEFLKVRYIDSGTYTSEIYDTTLPNPQFSQIRWTLSKDNPNIGAILKIRSNDDKGILAADSDWTDELTIDTGSISGNANIAAIAGGRYVQFQAILSSNADWTETPILRDVAIYWSGGTTACDLSGYFTLKPNYGIFNVEIDGKPLRKGLELKLSISEEIYKTGTVTKSLNAELESRNTGK